jgi:hypothetical protein
MELKWEQLRCGTRTAKIAGGTVLHIPADTNEYSDDSGRYYTTEVYPGGAVFVPHPPVMAEIGTFDPPAEAPPMTDEALRAWLTATYGEATTHPGDEEKLPTWRPFGGEYDEDDAIIYDENERVDSRWSVSPLGPFGGAAVIGPALWAAHRYGVQS